MRCWCLPSRSLTWTCGARFSLTLSSQEAPPCSKVGLCFWGPSPVSFQILLHLAAQRIHLRFSFPAHSGFGDRLLSEVKKLAPKDVKIRVRAWQGGAGWNWASKSPKSPMVWPPLQLCPSFSGSQGYTGTARQLCFHTDPDVCQRRGPILTLHLCKRRGRVLGWSPSCGLSWKLSH